MDTEMTRYESFAEVTEDFYCSAVDVLKILVLRLHDYHARCFHSLWDALYDYALPVLPERILLTVQSMQGVRYELYLFVYHF